MGGAFLNEKTPRMLPRLRPARNFPEKSRAPCVRVRERRGKRPARAFLGGCEDGPVPNQFFRWEREREREVSGGEKRTAPSFPPYLQMVARAGLRGGGNVAGAPGQLTRVE